eukprot:gene6984-4948_t
MIHLDTFSAFTSQPAQGPTASLLEMLHVEQQRQQLEERTTPSRSKGGDGASSSGRSGPSSSSTPGGASSSSSSEAMCFSRSSTASLPPAPPLGLDPEVVLELVESGADVCYHRHDQFLDAPILHTMIGMGRVECVLACLRTRHPINFSLDARRGASGRRSALHLLCELASPYRAAAILRGIVERVRHTTGVPPAPNAASGSGKTKDAPAATLSRRFRGGLPELRSAADGPPRQRTLAGSSGFIPAPLSRPPRHDAEGAVPGSSGSVPRDVIDWGAPDARLGLDFLSMAAHYHLLSVFWPIVKDLPYFQQRLAEASGGEGEKEEGGEKQNLSPSFRRIEIHTAVFPLDWAELSFQDRQRLLLTKPVLTPSAALARLSSMEHQHNPLGATKLPCMPNLNWIQRYVLDGDSPANVLFHKPGTNLAAFDTPAFEPFVLTSSIADDDWAALAVVERKGAVGELEEEEEEEEVNDQRYFTFSEALVPMRNPTAFLERQRCIAANAALHALQTTQGDYCSQLMKHDKRARQLARLDHRLQLENTGANPSSSSSSGGGISQLDQKFSPLAANPPNRFSTYSACRDESSCTSTPTTSAVSQIRKVSSAVGGIQTINSEGDANSTSGAFTIAATVMDPRVSTPIPAAAPLPLPSCTFAAVVKRCAEGGADDPEKAVAILELVLQRLRHRDKRAHMTTLHRRDADVVDWGQRDAHGHDFISCAAAAGYLSIFWPLLRHYKVPFFMRAVEAAAAGSCEAEGNGKPFETPNGPAATSSLEKHHLLVLTCPPSQADWEQLRAGGWVLPQMEKATRGLLPHDTRAGAGRRYCRPAPTRVGAVEAESRAEDDEEVHIPCGDAVDRLAHRTQQDDEAQRRRNSASSGEFDNTETESEKVKPWERMCWMPAAQRLEMMAKAEADVKAKEQQQYVLRHHSKERATHQEGGPQEKACAGAGHRHAASGSPLMEGERPSVEEIKDAAAEHPQELSEADDDDDDDEDSPVRCIAENAQRYFSLHLLQTAGGSGTVGATKTNVNWGTLTLSRLCGTKYGPNNNPHRFPPAEPNHDDRVLPHQHRSDDYCYDTNFPLDGALVEECIQGREVYGTGVGAADVMYQNAMMSAPLLHQFIQRGATDAVLSCLATRAALDFTLTDRHGRNTPLHLLCFQSLHRAKVPFFALFIKAIPLQAQPAQWDWEQLSAEDQSRFALPLGPFPHNNADDPREANETAEDDRALALHESGAMRGTRLYLHSMQHHEKESEADFPAWPPRTAALGKRLSPYLEWDGPTPLRAPPRIPPLHSAAALEQLEQLIVAEGGDVMYMTPRMRRPILHELVYRGEVAAVRLCLEKTPHSIDFTRRDWFGRTLLHYICHHAPSCTPTTAAAPNDNDDDNSTGPGEGEITTSPSSVSSLSSRSSSTRWNGQQEDLSMALLQLVLVRLSRASLRDVVDWGLRDDHGHDFLSTAAQKGMLCRVWPVVKYQAYYAARSAPVEIMCEVRLEDWTRLSAENQKCFLLTRGIAIPANAPVEALLSRTVGKVKPGCLTVSAVKETNQQPPPQDRRDEIVLPSIHTTMYSHHHQTPTTTITTITTTNNNNSSSSSSRSSRPFLFSFFSFSFFFVPSFTFSFLF